MMFKKNRSKKGNINGTNICTNSTYIHSEIIVNAVEHTTSNTKQSRQPKKKLNTAIKYNKSKSKKYC